MKHACTLMHSKTTINKEQKKAFQHRDISLYLTWHAFEHLSILTHSQPTYQILPIQTSHSHTFAQKREQNDGQVQGFCENQT